MPKFGEIKTRSKEGQAEFLKIKTRHQESQAKFLETKTKGDSDKDASKK